jgi:hypothetical protein
MLLGCERGLGSEQASVADLTFLPALRRVLRQIQSHTRIIWLLVSLWFRHSYECVLRRDTNVGTGTLAILARLRTPSHSDSRTMDRADDNAMIARSATWYSTHPYAARSTSLKP